MKHLKEMLGVFLLVIVLLGACKKDDNTSIFPTSDEFQTLRETALETRTQNFQFDVGDGIVSYTSTNGVELSINTNCLTLNGSPVTGVVDVEYIELFDRGNMLVTNKPTMGLTPDNDKALLISGGEFYIQASQNGTFLEGNCWAQLTVPTALTGGGRSGMSLWSGVFDAEGDLTWEEEVDSITNQGVFNELDFYYAYFDVFDDFSWTNCDIFHSDPRPKTTILAEVPEGYDYGNSAIYLSYDGEGAALAQLDWYLEDTQQFSEHYGLVPIGLECHAIFVTEEDGKWRYAIQPVTVVENGVIQFDFEDTTLETEDELVNAINVLP